MDLLGLIKWGERKAGLFALYWARIVFAPNYLPVSPLVKLRANLSGGFLADQWVLYGLDGKKKKEYLSEFDWYKSRYINAPFNYMLNNKVISTEVFSRYVRMPQVYLVNNHGITTGTGGGVLSIEQILELIRTKGDAVIKPFGRGKGTGVHRIVFGTEGFVLDGTPVEEQTMFRCLERWRDWYLTETIFQHPYAAALYDKTVNTIRIITLRSPESGQFKIFFAVQRVGTSHTIPVDNASQGGLVCRVDLDSGRLSAAKSLHELTTYDKHPDTGQRFEDVVIPGWQDLKNEILTLANRFPYLAFVAWDVVKLHDGQNCVIEANTSSGVNIIQLWGGQRNGELGDFYRFHHVIR